MEKKFIKINRIDTYRIGNKCKYEIFKYQKLGNNIYSSVILGRCLNLEKLKQIYNKEGLVAVKIIDIHKFTFDVQQLFINEINILKEFKIYHPNIVNCYDCIEENDITYICMEYCNNGCLKDLLIKPMKINYIKYYLNQLINALYFLQKFNILHRDIKPSNILITQDYKILKLAEFGFAKFISEQSNVNSICGSPLYMSPEMLSQKNYDNSIDIWSLGIILFQMMFGYHPCYMCKDINDLKLFISENKIIFPITINDTINNSDIVFLKQLLEIDVGKRIKLNELYNHDWLNNNFVFDYSDIYCNIEDDV